MQSDSEASFTGIADKNSQNSDSNSTTAYMPIIVGVLLAVIVLLAAVIFFIVSKTRHRKWLNSAETSVINAGEKISLNHHHHDVTSAFQFNNTMNGYTVKLDDNYNTPLHHCCSSTSTPRTRTLRPTPLMGRHQPPLPPRPPPPREEVVYTEPSAYVEPYRPVRYNYYGYGRVLSQAEMEMKQSLLGESNGEYAVPMNRRMDVPDEDNSSTDYAESLAKVMIFYLFIYF